MENYHICNEMSVSHGCQQLFSIQFFRERNANTSMHRSLFWVFYPVTSRLDFSTHTCCGVFSTKWRHHPHCNCTTPLRLGCQKQYYDLLFDYGYEWWCWGGFWGGGGGESSSSVVTFGAVAKSGTAHGWVTSIVPCCRLRGGHSYSPLT